MQSLEGDRKLIGRRHLITRRVTQAEYRLSNVDLRTKRITAALKLDGEGIEYGPLHRPVLLKSACAGVRYIDVAAREFLVRKYQGDASVDTRLIPEIDIVTDGRPIVDFVEADSLDFVVASHVLEHVPDFIGWLRDNLLILRPGGRISIAFPDRRYCFDIAREKTTTSDLVAAHLEARTKPSFLQVCDHIMNVRRVDPVSVWAGETDSSNAPNVHPPFQALELLRAAQLRTDYIDVHCWKFSDVELYSVLYEIRQLFKLSFDLLTFFPVQRNTSEFYFTLEKSK